MHTENYKVLVVDDEYWIRENLRTIIDWQKYGFVFMEPATDGEDALSKMEAECPDIIITDINMPFIRGTEITSIVKECYPQVVVIILSGYSDFEYVRDTLLAGAIDYLLKPITKINLLNVLAKAVEIISRNRTLVRERETAKDKLLKASSILQDKEYSALITGNGLSLAENPAYQQVLEMDLELIGFSLILIKINNIIAFAKKNPELDTGSLSYRIKNIIKKLAGEDKLIVFNNVNKQNEYILIYDIDEKNLDEVCKDLIKGLEKVTGSTVNIAVSNRYFSLKKLRIAYSEAISAFMMRSYCHSSSITKFKDIEKVPVKKRITAEQENKLMYAVQCKNRKQVNQLIFEKIGLKECQNKEWLFIEIKQTVEKITRILIDNTDANNSPLEIMAVENLIELLEEKLESFDITEVCSLIEQIIDECFSMTDSISTNETIKDTVKLVAEYIDNNYFEELSLTSISKLFFVESSYLSRAFKHEMGENLMLYIAKKRIQKAIELIMQDELSLLDISYLVGYNDYTYFNRVFRKITGKSPREYKNGCSEA